jgi:hypothetical protein
MSHALCEADVAHPGVTPDSTRIQSIGFVGGPERTCSVSGALTPLLLLAISRIQR